MNVYEYQHGLCISLCTLPVILKFRKLTKEKKVMTILRNKIFAFSALNDSFYDSCCVMPSVADPSDFCSDPTWRFGSGDLGKKK